MPMPSAATFFLSSIEASSSSRRAIALAFSATSLAAGPRPGDSVSGVGMASPVDYLRDHDADHEGCADDQERTRAAAALLRPRAELRPRRRRGRSAPGRHVGRGLAFGPRDDAARSISWSAFVIS